MCGEGILPKGGARKQRCLKTCHESVHTCPVRVQVGLTRSSYLPANVSILLPGRNLFRLLHDRCGVLFCTVCVCGRVKRPIAALFRRLKRSLISQPYCTYLMQEKMYFLLLFALCVVERVPFGRRKVVTRSLLATKTFFLHVSKILHLLTITFHNIMQHGYYGSNTKYKVNKPHSHTDVSWRVVDPVGGGAPNTLTDAVTRCHAGVIVARVIVNSF